MSASSFSTGQLSALAQEHQRWIRESFDPARIVSVGSPPLQEAYERFSTSQLGFPSLPANLAEQLMALREWRYVANFPGEELLALEEVREHRQLESCKYGYLLSFHQREVVEALDSMTDHCLLLDHSGHGINSYAVHFLMMFGPVRLFLQMGWGGVYQNNEAAAATIQEVFGLVDVLLHTLDAYLTCYGTLPEENMYMITSNMRGGWDFGVGACGERNDRTATPKQVLQDAIEWLQHQVEEGAARL